MPQLCGQQYVGRFEVYAGYMFLDSPKLNLFEPGYHIQVGMRYSRHISMGFDFSRGTGDTALTSELATDALQARLKSYLDPLKAGGLLPPDYQPRLPLNSETATFTAGPQFVCRKWNKFTPFIRPSIGAIREYAVARPNDIFTKALVTQIAPSGTKLDWTAFYGVGGGVAFNVLKHFSLVVQADFVHDHLYNDLLRDGRNTVRFSVGPGFQFGHNVDKKWF
ncbi:MAG: hypothetical protein U0Q18_32245 [Bryobacteraceae bacterium]